MGRGWGSYCAGALGGLGTRYAAGGGSAFDLSPQYDQNSP